MKTWTTSLKTIGMNIIYPRISAFLYLLIFIFIAGCAANPQQDKIDKPQISEQPIESSLLSPPDSEPQLMDQLEIRSNVFDVVFQDFSIEDNTSDLEASLGLKSGVFIPQIVMYNIKNTEITDRDKFALYLNATRTCRKFEEKYARSLINPGGSGYSINTLRAFYGIDGYLSDDRKKYIFTCNVSYSLKPL